MAYWKLSYAAVVIQWITSGHKNRITTRVKTLWRVLIMSLTTSMSTMRFLIDIMFILESRFINSYNMTTRVRSSIFCMVKLTLLCYVAHICL